MRLPKLSLRRLALLTIGVPLLAGAGWVGDVFVVHDNFRAASPELYRAGRLRADQWQESHGRAGYKSVLNLLGARPDLDWYRTEMQFAADKGLEHYDYPLSAHVAPTVDQMRELVALMRKAPKPLLIHCKNGSDRSGLVAALYRLAIEGQPEDVAERQLSLWYGHFPWLGSRSGAMDVAFDRFVAAGKEQAVASQRVDKPL